MFGLDQLLIRHSFMLQLKGIPINVYMVHFIEKLLSHCCLCSNLWSKIGFDRKCFFVSLSVLLTVILCHELVEYSISFCLQESKQIW